jgi:hypothetical protein
VSSPQFPPAAPAEGVVWVLGATLIDGSANAARPNMAPVTRGDRISAVLPATDFHAAPGEDIVKVHGRYIVQA